MDDDDWDLQAVVRGCATAVKATRVSTRTPAAAPATNNHPFSYLPSNLPYYDDPNSFDFPGLVDDRNDPFQGLQEIYQEFCLDDQPPTTAATADISATSLIPAPPPFCNLQPPPHNMQVSPPLRLNMQIQENVQFTISPTLGSPPKNLPASIPQPTRPRRRKNQQIKMVKQLTQEELSADSWAWRKYGQKPIKGSSYPRNYYRCSTSKGCAARKQVERSSDDPEVFAVTYSGEHTHPRPTHRSSLCGSTRSKFSSSQPKSGSRSINNVILSQKGRMASSSAPTAGPSFSPSMEGEAAAPNDDVHMAEEVDGDEDENAIMIPTDFMNDDDDDMFRAFQDSDDHSSSGGGDFFSSGLLLSPPWTPTSPAGNTGPFNGGGGSI